MHQIVVYAKEKFDNMMIKLQISDENVELVDGVFICIHNTFGMTPYFQEHSNVINLFFDDWTPQELNTIPITDRDITLFDDSMADKLAKFFSDNKNKHVWHLHCYAGISRSGAVSVWLANKLGLKAMSVCNKYSLKPNMHVLNLLRANM